MNGTTFFGFTGASSGGGGTISGTIASPQVAFGSASNTIAGDATFTFNASTTDKEVTASRFQLSSHTPVATPVAGYIEYDGTNFYGTIGATRYKFSMTT